ncbi:metallophosphoesterase family protein [Halobacillus litoralis]|uniref:metallophosphoesterase family protein n=1 Tax=Halobacillus litoralis TaxID=45668 RepID=UPI001CFEDBD5|nr:DNA repair exonuclease [Halobacillus litoralis]
MVKPIRFIHSADLHIDSLFKTKGNLPEMLLEKLRASTFEAFERLIDLCIDQKVDFLLISGDLYNEEIRSLKAQVHLRRGFERLNEQDIQVYLSYGNHDYIKGSKYPIEFPENVHVFLTHDVAYFPYVREGETRAHVYGFSYEKREVRERKATEYRKTEGADLHIAMLHGSIETNTDHDVYAPFSLGELKSLGMDYWALGHIHKRQVLSEDPPVVYPGNIQGRSRKELGGKGVYLVEEHKEGLLRTFHPLHSFTYEHELIHSDQLKDVSEIEQVLEEAKRRASLLNTPVMLTVTLSSSEGFLREWWGSGIIQEWTDVLNEAEDLGSNEWIWIEEVKIEDRPSWSEGELVKSHHFSGEFLKHLNETKESVMNEWLAPLYAHRKLSKYVDVLSEAERKEVIEEAKSLTVESLLGEEGESNEN